MNRKTLTLIIALTCAVVLALGCFAVQALTAGDKQKTDAPVNSPDSNHWGSSGGCADAHT